MDTCEIRLGGDVHFTLGFGHQLEVSFSKLLLRKNFPHLAEVRYVTADAGVDALGR